MGIICAIYMLCSTIDVETFEMPILEGEALYDTYIYEICEDYELDPDLVKAFVWHESRYDPTVINGNCIGLMQVSRTWHKDRAERLGVTDWFDPYSNILIGSDYLSELLTDYDDLELAVMLYSMKRRDAFYLDSQGRTSRLADRILDKYYELKEGGE